jgi:hypothetical protein
VQGDRLLVDDSCCSPLLEEHRSTFRRFASWTMNDSVCSSIIQGGVQRGVTNCNARSRRDDPSNVLFVAVPQFDQTPQSSFGDENHFMRRD